MATGCSLSKKVEKEATRIPLNEGMEFSWVQILVVLVCYLDASGSTETQVKGRLDQGRKMFGKLRPMLCCSRIPEEERIKTFYTTVASSVVVEFGWLDPVDQNTAAYLHPGNQVAPLYAGGREAQDVPWIGFEQQNALHRRQDAG